MQFKGPSREISRLLRNIISNVKLKLEINNVKTDLKIRCFFLKSVYCFFRLIKNTCKTSAVTFRVRCIESQKMLLPPSLHKLLIV